MGTEDTGGKAGTVGGGRSTRGPEPDPGGATEPGGLVPPYEGRSTGPGETESTRARAESIERQLATTKEGRHGATASPADEHPADPSQLTDEEPESPKGVGESLGTRGEELGRRIEERGRHDAPPDDTPAGRPAGTSSAGDSTGVNAQDPQDGAPGLQSGDQGG